VNTGEIASSGDMKKDRIKRRGSHPGGSGISELELLSGQFLCNVQHILPGGFDRYPVELRQTASRLVNRFAAVKASGDFKGGPIGNDPSGAGSMQKDNPSLRSLSKIGRRECNK
jgi:hypothetical protein